MVEGSLKLCYMDKINQPRKIDGNAALLNAEHFQDYLKISLDQFLLGILLHIYIFNLYFFFWFTRLWGLCGSAVVTAGVTPVAWWVVNVVQGQYSAKGLEVL